MLVAAGGRERTGRGYGELLSQTGFDLEKIIPTPSPVSIFIGRPCDGSPEVRLAEWHDAVQALGFDG